MVKKTEFIRNKGKTMEKEEFLGATPFNRKHHPHRTASHIRQMLPGLVL